MIEFGNTSTLRWVDGHGYVEQTVHSNGQPLKCRVSQEALEDHFGARGEGRKGERCLNAAQRGFDRISDEWGDLIAAGRFEPDGAVLLRTRDLGQGGNG